MDPKFQEQVDHLIAEGYKFDFGKFINEGFNIFKENAGGYIGYIIVGSLLAMIAIFVSVFLFGIGLILGFATATILMVGMYIVAHKIYTKQAHSFGDFFGGFSHFGPLFMAYLVMFLIGILCAVISYIPYFTIIPWEDFASANSPQDYGEAMISMANEMNKNPWAQPIQLLLSIPSYYFSIVWGFSYFFIIFTGASFWEAMEASRKVIQKNFFMFLGFLLIWTLIIFVSILPLGLGLFVTIPAYFASMYVAFHEIVYKPAIERAEQTTDFSQHLVDDNPQL